MSQQAWRVAGGVSYPNYGRKKWRPLLYQPS
jgi:hypothetical protein